MPTTAPIEGHQLRNTFAIVITGAAVLLLAACGSDEPQTFDATGKFQVAVATTDGVGTNCVGRRGYSDLGPGTVVEVSDASDRTLAVGELEATTWTADPYGCVFDFTVKDIPAGEKLYKVEVAHRGQMTKTEAEMRVPLRFSLGG